MQIIFQDPYGSLDPRMTVSDILDEPLRIHRAGDRASARATGARAARRGRPAHANMPARYPHEFSGGQRQRIGIARALALKPRFIVCDEPVSALDVSIQAQIINLMLDLQKEFGLTYLFIAHDLGVVKHVADRVAVMYLGRIVEIADKQSLYAAPRHPYTQALLAAVPIPRPSARQALTPLTGRDPKPQQSAVGLPFPHALPVRRTTAAASRRPRCARWRRDTGQPATCSPPMRIVVSSPLADSVLPRRCHASVTAPSSPPRPPWHTTSRITSEIDFNRDGKQVGFLRLPHSVHRSAYGWIPIPVACISNGDGPRVLLMAGNHGDEYEGQIAFSSCCARSRRSDVRGRLIFLTSANFPAAMAGTRTSPIDEGNLNRSFPGRHRRRRDRADRLVHRARAAAAMRLCLRPAFRRQFADVRAQRPLPAPGGPDADGARARIAEGVRRAVSYVTDAPQGEDRTLTAAAARQGVMHLGTELGGGGTLTRRGLAHRAGRRPCAR